MEADGLRTRLMKFIKHIFNFDNWEIYLIFLRKRKRYEMWSQSLVIVEKNQSDTWKYETTNRAQSACLDDILSSKYQPSFHNEVIDANELSELIKREKIRSSQHCQFFRRTGGNVANNHFTFRETIKRWQ